MDQGQIPKIGTWYQIPRIAWYQIQTVSDTKHLVSDNKCPEVLEVPDTSTRSTGYKTRSTWYKNKKYLIQVLEVPHKNT